MRIAVIVVLTISTALFAGLAVRNSKPLPCEYFEDGSFRCVINRNGEPMWANGCAPTYTGGLCND